MGIKTFTAELQKPLVPFAIKYSKKHKATRNRAMRLVTGDLSKTKQNQELQKLGYNKRQANSLLIDIEGKIGSAKECREAHIETLEGKIKSAEEQITEWEEKLGKLEYACCGVRRNQFKSRQHELRFKIHHKRRYVLAQKRKLEKLREAPIQVNFGTEYNFSLVGSQGESNGNQICQYDSKKKSLKIRVPAEFESEFGKYVSANLEFAYGQDCIEAALMRRSVNRKNLETIPAGKGESLSWRIFFKNNRWYIAVSIEVTEVPLQSKPVRYGCIGVDLNPGVVGWCYVDFNGNPVAKGQIKLNLHSRRSGQVKAELSDAIKQLILLAQLYGCAIVIENLSFSAKKKRMREEGRRYSRMLNFFAYSTFNEVLQSQARKGIQVIKVNSAYSSLIGLTKFMSLYGMSSDTAAGLVLARRAMRLSESVPTHFALPAVMVVGRHVWSSWYRINKSLGSVRRHEFFNQQTLTAYLSHYSTSGKLVEVGKSEVIPVEEPSENLGCNPELVVKVG
ncbi:transposase, IS605 OrfB family, central region [Rivularia sp. PCC 7116]|uniref:IS200/IS605 family accessory protein TnpB-related protein n=1 Tax=Rivularia sp. PCC 7116 TaxID=373994 RepID=UPI00029EEC6F|nr:IS200/IS605 family accessory protein TnpB-related protein [Rivularia sp. PCC 7116]AFY57215.1 transposase, IS605 OrfB family, central region [Rivularia sp. PCC 7116]